MLNGPFSPWPSYSQQEADAVSAVLLSGRVNYWTGEEGRAFETEFASWADTRHAIAVANGTVAIDLALAGLGIGARNGGSALDEVIVTPRSFMASVSSVVFAGAVPVFADVDPDSGNMTAATIAPHVGKWTKAILPVHLAGWPCDMDPILALARPLGIRVIEDCAQAHGALYKGRPVGSIGDVGAWSFCQDKIMTTGGEGGMVTTNDPALWERMWSFKDHGKSWDAVYDRQHPPGFRWLHESFGTNWRMTEMQAAIGRLQLGKMPKWHQKRAEHAAVLSKALGSYAGREGAIRLPEPPDDIRHAQYKYYAYVRPENLNDGWSRDRIVDEVAARGVPCFQGSCSEIYKERAFDGTGWRPERGLETAQALGETSLMFLVHPTLSDAEMELSSHVVSEVLSRASRRRS